MPGQYWFQGNEKTFIFIYEKLSNVFPYLLIVLAWIFAWQYILCQVTFMPTDTIIIKNNWNVLPVKFEAVQRVIKYEDTYGYDESVT